MKILRTASFLLVIMAAVTAVSLAGDTPMVGLVMPAPIVQAAAFQPSEAITDSQQKAFNQAYQAMQQRMEVSTVADCCPPPCPPICP